MASHHYQPKEFEGKIWDLWETENVYGAKSPVSKDKNKMYCLSMFPYPSGAGLHVGHVRIYTGTDVLARYFRMMGHPVLHPMGWDAFGLPAENAAIKAKKNPMDMVPHNIATFKKQMQHLGFSYDWKREFATTDPTYYRYTQWLFIQFFKMGLLYKKMTPIHFCPKCKTGLAEEEVLPNNTHERCGSVIEKRDLPQWIFRITAYADRLLEDLRLLEWPKGILEMQKNWIGKKQGINITYSVINPKFEIQNPKGISKSELSQSKEEIVATITCFTTRPDTNFGATFIVIAPEHELALQILNPKSQIRKRYNPTETKIQEIKKYVEDSKNKSQIERETEGRKKTGVFTGLYAVNQLTGYKMPIWISDFVLMGFGTGAVVGVPGHDMRDFEFAKEYDIPVIRVVKGSDGDTSEITKGEQVQEEEGVMVNSGFLNGMDIHEATHKIMDYMEEKGYGKRVTTYHLRDWIFSRQRYWGEPIPMVYCEKCANAQIQNEEFKNQNYNATFKIDKEILKANAGWFALSEEQLPLELPYVTSYEPTDTGESPLSKIETFVKTTCPNCGGVARRETDTMPNWAGSCWYFLQFAFHSTHEVLKKGSIVNSSSNKEDSNIHSRTFYNTSLNEWLANRNRGEGWLPVDWYLGGAEHAVLHLLYARFWVKALQDAKLLNFPEPFLRLRNVGMVLAEDHRKMSKSLGNVINPDDVIAEYGADTLRIYEMFMAPFDQEISWSTQALQGAYRFVNRIWQIYHDSAKISDRTNEDRVQKTTIALYKTIDKVGKDIPQIKFNTAIASMMEFLNVWEKGDNALDRKGAESFLKILSLFAPFIAEKLWIDVLGNKGSIMKSDWPQINKTLLVETKREIPVLVNGKVRGKIEIHIDLSEQDVVIRALANDKIQAYIKDKTYKTIYVKGKILNFIV